MSFKSIFETIGRWMSVISLPERYILPLFTLQWGCGPDWRNVEVSFGHGKHDASLYYNGILFFRVMLPFFIGLHVRWSGDPAVRRQFLQTHIGWKKNGDFAITFRIQNDASAAAGSSGPNVNQAQGWNCGTH